VPEGGCRLDVWLWRARFFKTRGVAAKEVEAGRIRLVRHGQSHRIEKAARAVGPGDELVFVLGGRLKVLRIEAVGERRGPASEARALYVVLDSEE
jgi:ribosomal 50S subunit-recycling heat shock protein